MYQSHVLSREGQITVRFTGHSRIMGYQQTGCFISTFWHLEYEATARFLENLWIPGKVGVPDKTSTGYLQNTRQKHCHLTQLFSKKKGGGNKIQVARLHGKRQLGQLGVCGRIILKLVLKG